MFFEAAKFSLGRNFLPLASFRRRNLDPGPAGPACSDRKQHRSATGAKRFFRFSNDVTITSPASRTKDCVTLDESEKTFNQMLILELRISSQFHRKFFPKSFVLETGMFSKAGLHERHKRFRVFFYSVKKKMGTILLPSVFQKADLFGVCLNSA
jgi:hypothetical protein